MQVPRRKYFSSAVGLCKLTGSSQSFVKVGMALRTDGAPPGRIRMLFPLYAQRSEQPFVRALLKAQNIVTAEHFSLCSHTANLQAFQ